MRPAVKWHGGKAYLAKRIVARFPAHRVYVEPFAGGLSVLLNKSRCQVEIVGDVDAGLIEFYTALREQSIALLSRLQSIPYVAESFVWANTIGEADDAIERASKFLIRNRFSRGGLGTAFAWSDRLRGGQPGDVNAWETILDELPRIASRLQGVEIRQAEAIDLIRCHDGRDTLFYLDPPYVHHTRTARDAYRHEMTDQDHALLLETVSRVEGMVVLSGYASDLYDRCLATWERHRFDMPNNAGQGRTKQRRVEVVWMNQACDRFRLSPTR
jgi:DNA adenine methylase